MSLPMVPVAISITTHNRLVDLRRTLQAVAELNPRPAEIWVCADGCSDDTVAYLQTKVPRYRLLVHATGLGSVTSRDEILRSTEQPYILSLDDDSYPVESDFLQRAWELMQAYPDIAVLCFPQRTDEFPETLEAVEFGPSLEVASFANSGAMIRRDAYLACSGYPGFFFHAYEEPDLALQVMAAGYRVVYYTGLTIRHHFTAQGRNEMRTHQRHARNEAWSAILRCPWPWLPAILAYRAIRQAMYAGRRGWRWVVAEPRWWWAALTGCGPAWRSRQAVPWPRYRAWLQLLGRPRPILGLPGKAADQVT